MKKWCTAKAMIHFDFVLHQNKCSNQSAGFVVAVMQSSKRRNVN